MALAHDIAAVLRQAGCTAEDLPFLPAGAWKQALDVARPVQKYHGYYTPGEKVRQEVAILLAPASSQE